MENPKYNLQIWRYEFSLILYQYFKIVLIFKNANQRKSIHYSFSIDDIRDAADVHVKG